MQAARKVGNVQGGSDSLERRHWEFSFDSRPTNLTWSWRLVDDKGRTAEKSIAFADLRSAVDDAVKRGFSPDSGDWVVRGVLVRPRAPAHEQRRRHGLYRDGPERYSVAVVDRGVYPWSGAGSRLVDAGGGLVPAPRVAVTQFESSNTRRPICRFQQN